MTKAEMYAEQARKNRFRNPLVNEFNWDSIYSSLSEMCEDAEEAAYSLSVGKDTVSAMLEENGYEAEELANALHDFGASADRLREEMDDAASYDDELGENVDWMLCATMAGTNEQYLGYDTYEEDYYSLTDPYEVKGAEAIARDRIKKLTKDRLIDLMSLTNRLVHGYVSIRYRYDSLQQGIDLLKGETAIQLNTVAELERLYDIIMSEDTDPIGRISAESKFNRLTDYLDWQVWLM